jgi:hypothetical protein
MFSPGDTHLPFMPNHDFAQHAGCCVTPVITLLCVQHGRRVQAGKEMIDRHVTWRRSSGTFSPGCIRRSLNSRLKKKKNFVVLIGVWQQGRTWTLVEDSPNTISGCNMRHDGFPAYAERGSLRQLFKTATLHTSRYECKGVIVVHALWCLTLFWYRC